MFTPVISTEDALCTFRRDIESAANRVLYGAGSGTLIEAAARILLTEYEPRDIAGCSNGANSCAIYVPARAAR